MRVIAQDIPDRMRHDLYDFAEWVKLVSEVKIVGNSFGEDQEPDWIQTSEKFLIKNGKRALHMLIESYVS